MEALISKVIEKWEKHPQVHRILVKIGVVPPPYGCREVMHDIILYFKLSAFNPPEDRDVREVKERFSAHLPGIGSGAGGDDCEICSRFYRRIQRKMTGGTTQ